MPGPNLKGNTTRTAAGTADRHHLFSYKYMATKKGTKDSTTEQGIMASYTRVHTNAAIQQVN